MSYLLFFDSGLGGLSVLREAIRQHPEEDYTRSDSQFPDLAVHCHAIGTKLSHVTQDSNTPSLGGQ